MNAQEQLLMDQELESLITSRTICKALEISEDTLSRLMKVDANFPRPVTLIIGPRGPRRWIRAEVQAYFKSLKSARKA